MAQNHFNLLLSLVSLSGLSLLLYFFNPFNFEFRKTKSITAPKSNETDKIKLPRQTKKPQEDEKVEEVNDEEDDDEIPDDEKFEEIDEKTEVYENKKDNTVRNDSKINEEKERLAEEQRLIAIKKKSFEEKQAEGTKKFKEGHYQDAITLYNSAMDILEELNSLPQQQQSNYEISLLNNRAAAYEKLKRFDLALQDCLFVLSSDPFHIKTRTRKARIHQDQGELKNALKEICIIERIYIMRQEQGELPPMLQPILDQLSDELIQEFESKKEKPAHGSYTKRKSLISFAAIELLLKEVHNWEIFEIEEKLEEENDLTTKAHLLFQKALILIHQNKFDTVKSELETAAKYLLEVETEQKEQLEDANTDNAANTQDALIWAFVGIFRSFENEFESSFDAFERSVKLDPSNLDLWIIYATSSLESNLEKSKELFAHANTLGPKNADFYFHRAQYSVVNRDLETAKKDAELAVSCDPNNFSAKALYQQLVLETMDQAEMPAVFQDLMQDNEHPDLLALKAHIYLGSGQSDEVLKCAQRIHDCEPDNPVSFMLKAQCFFQLDKFDDALTMLNQAFLLEPTTDVLLQISQIKLLKSQSLDEATSILESFEKAIRLSITPWERKEAAKVFLLTEGKVEAAKTLGLNKFSDIPGLLR